jgi:hypothetical protein
MKGGYGGTGALKSALKVSNEHDDSFWADFRFFFFSVLRWIMALESSDPPIFFRPPFFFCRH